MGYHPFENSETRLSGVKEVAESAGSRTQLGLSPSGAEALIDSVGFIRGLKPPLPSGLSFCLKGKDAAKKGQLVVKDFKASP